MDSDMKKIIIASLLLIAAASGIIAVRHAVCLSPAKPAKNDVPVLKEWENNSMADLPPGYVSRCQWQWAGDAERAQLESVWAVAATNLLNGNVQGMKECVAPVSERMKSIAPQQFYGIVSPCFVLLKRWFTEGFISQSYTTPSEFKSHVMVNVEGMNFLGEIELSAEQNPLRCAYLEADVLAMIRKCIQKFTDEGREDFVLVAKELEEMIINQIESENGLTRRYMNADLKGQMLLYERGYSTRENVIRGVRTLAQYLENTTGYIPKWLDEFK